MSNQFFPNLCKACIERNKAQCQHIHTEMFGGFHFTAGEIWDDLTLVCLDCGTNLDELPLPEEITIVEEYHE
jgi:hypothetical protein